MICRLVRLNGVFVGIAAAWFAVAARADDPGAAQSPDALRWLSEVEVDALSSATRDAGLNAKRVRVARIEPAFESGEGWERISAGAVLILPMFDDARFEGIVSTVTRPGPGRLVVSGSLRGLAGGQVRLAIGNGVVQGSVHAPGRGFYRIQRRAGGEYWVSELEPASAARCGVDQHGPIELLSATTGSIAPRRRAGLMAVAPLDGPADGEVHVVDLMVVYTADAEAGAGGQAEIESLIDLAVAEANSVYQNSHAAVRIRLVHTAMVAYEESSSLFTNLTRLRDVGDGFLDEVHDLRVEKEADLVCLITESADSGIGGLALTMTEASEDFRKDAFSVVQRSQAVGDSYLFAHELSHNFGCHHDRANAVNLEGNPATVVFPYAHGHLFLVGDRLFRTVMAYPPSGLVGAEVVPFLSNPTILYGGVPLGVPLEEAEPAYNVLTINNTAALVSQFFGTEVRTLAPQVALSLPADGFTTVSGQNVEIAAVAGDADGAVQLVEFYSNDVMLGAADAPVDGFYRLNWSEVPAGEFTLTVRAVDDVGATSLALPNKIVVRPRNDAFAEATVLTGETFSLTDSNVAASFEGGEKPHASNPGGTSVWFLWTAPRSGKVRVVATGNQVFPLLDVYVGDELAALQTPARLLDFDSEQNMATLTFDAIGGRMYRFVIDGFEGRTGTFYLTLNIERGPDNDEFAAREELPAQALIAFQSSNVAGSREEGEPEHGSNPGGKSVWYRWSAPRAGTVAVSVKGTGFFPLLDVYQGDALAELSRVPERRVQFENGANLALLYFTAIEGGEYSFAVDGFSGGEGEFAFVLEYPEGPPNDDFADRMLVDGWDFELNGTTQFATSEPGEPLHFGNPGGRSVWYRWTAPVSGPVTLTVAATNYFPLVDVYTGDAVDALARVAGTPVVGDLSAQITITAVAGNEYAVAVDGFEGWTGPFVLGVESVNRPPSLDLRISPAGGLLQLEISGSPGQPFLLESSIDLKEWVPVVSDRFVEPVYQHNEPIANGGAKFFRVSPLP